MPSVLINRVRSALIPKSYHLTTWNWMDSVCDRFGQKKDNFCARKFCVLDENVIYDLALFRLLTLVEIPVLDGILQFKGRREHSSKGASLENLFASLGLSSSSGRKKSHCLDDQSEISKYLPCKLPFRKN